MVSAANPCVRICVMRDNSVWLTAFCSVVRSRAVHSRSIQARLPVPEPKVKERYFECILRYDYGVADALRFMAGYGRDPDAYLVLLCMRTCGNDNIRQLLVPRVIARNIINFAQNTQATGELRPSTGGRTLRIARDECLAFGFAGCLHPSHWI